MSIPAALKNRDKSHEHQRQGDESEQDMCDQNWEIDPRDQTSISGGFLARVQMIDDVADQETGRGKESDNHAGDMPLPDIAADPKPAR